MIDRTEILTAAKRLSLRPDVVEKDYVLGWLLAGIYQQPELAKTWVFKGGTCLKKCYFETYRFSEDLDFTLTDEAQLAEEFLGRVLGQVCDWVYEESGIELPKDEIRIELLHNRRDRLACQVRVPYRGPIAPGGSSPRIKLDLTADEVLVRPPATRKVEHAYSDLPADGIVVACYDFVEIFAEKIRALVERVRPRDLYDKLVRAGSDERVPPDSSRIRDDAVELKFDVGVDLDQPDRRPDELRLHGYSRHVSIEAGWKLDQEKSYKLSGVKVVKTGQ